MGGSDSIHMKKNVVLKFNRMMVLGKMLLHSSQLPTDEEALKYLSKLSPDTGGSCIAPWGSDQTKRTKALSVIVPAYNVEQYIEKCLDSILQQTVPFEYEIIVVDDGSTDSTGNLLKNYENKDNIRILHQDNGGSSAARNTGILHSKGEYLCFVDSDDELPVNALQSLMTVALREQAKLVVGSYERCTRNGKVLFARNLRDEKLSTLSLPGYAWGRVIHHSVFTHLRFPEAYWYEDSIMAEIVHPMCQDATYTISDVSYLYYENQQGITEISTKQKKSIDSLWLTMRLLEERKKFNLEYNQNSYEYFLFMVNLTYHRTKHLGIEAIKSIFVVQRMLLEQYYSGYACNSSRKKKRIEEALRTRKFRKYVLACGCKK